MAKQQTPKAAAKPGETAAPYSVLKPFRDVNDWDLEHKPGDDVSHFDEERLASLVEKGLVQGLPEETTGDNLE
ncbi:hypothetical protein [Dyadobacter chenhuakuii]|uniref:Uncharacterized protein n=1 Tax=Dyadobacter chenhuakuii TaxID=2909339 RepID=A0A9X1QC34_9BACT|nr:hypothetical protein [Dyadobacter chenhuakuii]MCF2498396.1 hypothetical protein [Dyadobacter chenhuakuii]